MFTSNPLRSWEALIHAFDMHQNHESSHFYSFVLESLILITSMFNKCIVLSLEYLNEIEDSGFA